jgi:uncharacterized membrane protein HdeD (DUF308 family)
MIRGMVGLVFGLLAVTRPSLTVVALGGVFAAYALVDGISTLWFGLTSLAVSAAPTGQRMSTLMVRAVLGIAIGIFILLWRELTMMALLLAMAVWAVVTGVLEISAAVKLRRVIPDEGWLALSGILSIAFGLWLFAFPGLGLIGIARALGAYAFAVGVLLIAIGLRLRMRVHA